MQRLVQEKEFDPSAVCDAVGATKCDLEQLKGADLAKRFKEDTIPVGLYILFSEGHVLLYNSDIKHALRI